MQPVVVGIPGLREYWRNTQAIEWIINALSGGQRRVLTPDAGDFVEARRMGTEL